MGQIGELVEEPGGVVVRLHGDVDLATAEPLRHLLRAAESRQARRIVVDLSDVAFMDVQSLSAVLATADSLGEGGRSLVIRGASRALRRVCALLNADDVLAPEIWGVTGPAAAAS